MSRQSANALRRAIFAASRRSGLDDAARHDVQRRVTGKTSLTKMSMAEMHAVLDHLNGAPKPASSRTDALPSGTLGAKLTALWISAYHLGVVRDRRESAACAFVRRQTGLSAARFATPAQMARAIEALRDWMARDGGVDWSPYRTLDGKTFHKPAARVLEALWASRKGNAAAVQHDVNVETGEIIIAETGECIRYIDHDDATLNRLIAGLGAKRLARKKVVR